MLPHPLLKHMQAGIPDHTLVSRTFEKRVTRFTELTLSGLRIRDFPRTRVEEALGQDLRPDCGEPGNDTGQLIGIPALRNAYLPDQNWGEFLNPFEHCGAREDRDF
jgi:hypothetical protein